MTSSQAEWDGGGEMSGGSREVGELARVERHRGPRRRSGCVFQVEGVGTCPRRGNRDVSQVEGVEMCPG